MIDALVTLDEGTGLVRSFGVAPPDESSPLWSAGAELTLPPGWDEAAEVPLSARVVGACGGKRADAMIRGAGEVVERWSLHARPLPGQRRATAAELGDLALDFAGQALGESGAEDVEMTWYPGERMRDGREVMVPAGLVDWPLRDDAGIGLFDPGPSGAASGSSLEMAVRCALLEVVERDAVLCAWERGLVLPSVKDPRTLPEPCGAEEVSARERVVRLWEDAEEQGLTPGLHRLPTSHPGVWAVLGSLVEPVRGDHPVSSVGLKASDQPWVSLLGALNEAWQVRAAVFTTSAEGRPTAQHPLVTEEERMVWMASSEGHRVISEWVLGMADGGVTSAGPAVHVPTEDIVRALVGEGAEPVLVDLTQRLPERLRRMGWRAVKVIPVGLQHLRMDETYRWSLHQERLASSERRTGLTARYRAGEPRPPHPLP